MPGHPTAFSMFGAESARPSPTSSTAQQNPMTSSEMALAAALAAAGGACATVRPRAPRGRFGASPPRSLTQERVGKREAAPNRRVGAGRSRRIRGRARAPSWPPWRRTSTGRPPRATRGAWPPCWAAFRPSPRRVDGAAAAAGWATTAHVRVPRSPCRRSALAGVRAQGAGAALALAAAGDAGRRRGRRATLAAAAGQKSARRSTCGGRGRGGRPPGRIQAAPRPRRRQARPAAGG